MTDIQHVSVNSNGVHIHAAIQGEGPIVLLCHGMPGLWYSWRYQMQALADAGYKAVAIDQRGFGQSDRPTKVADYTSKHTVADVIAVLDHLQAEQAILVGTDFGAAQVYNCAVRHPDRVRAVVGIACPYDFDFSGRGCAGSSAVSSGTITRTFARPDMSPNECFAAIAKHQFFYAHYYQTPGMAEKEFAAKPAEFLQKLFWNLSADGNLLDQSHWPENPQGYCDVLKSPDRPLPWSWLSQEDFDYYLEQFCDAESKKEFIGGINLYRVADENWHINAQYADANITQPSMFIAGEKDAVLLMIDEQALEAFKSRCDDLRDIALIEGAGHFVQMEKPEQTNAVLLKFLESL
ncbi:MAG: alpha/beta hydrolase [Pseudomonadales bacterium]|nr:alpha/beta hydrolase [Pseudomonadales bacterium]